MAAGVCNPLLKNTLLNVRAASRGLRGNLLTKICELEANYNNRGSGRFGDVKISKPCFICVLHAFRNFSSADDLRWLPDTIKEGFRYRYCDFTDGESDKRTKGGQP